MTKINKEDFLYNVIYRRFENKVNFCDATVNVSIETNQNDFSENSELYIEQIKNLFINLPLILRKVATEHLSTAQFWFGSKEDSNTSSLQTAEDFIELLKMEAVTLCPEKEEDKSPYPCWWYFELFVGLKEEVFSDHGLVIKLDKNLEVLQSDVA